MGVGSTVKSWWGSLRKNKMVSEALASNTLRSYGRWATVGAGIGAVQGAARRVAGDNDASVIGGAVSGGVAFAGLRGAKAGLGRLFGRGKKKLSPMAEAAYAAANASGGGARSARAASAYAAAARGRAGVGATPSAGLGI